MKIQYILTVRTVFLEIPSMNISKFSSHANFYFNAAQRLGEPVSGELTDQMYYIFILYYQ